MRILLIAGHGAGQPGAVANGYREVDLTREVVSNVKGLLSNYATVDIYPTSRSCYKDLTNGTNQVNFANYNYVLEVHFNAGGGTGTEIYVTSREKAVDVEKAIVNNLSKYYKNRGVKVTNFLVIDTAKSKGVSSALLEVCFIDNANDVKVYQNNKRAIAQSIVDGIVSGFGLKKSSTTSDTTITSKKDQILNSGDTFTIPGVFKVSAVSASMDAIASTQLADKPFQTYNYIDAKPLIKTDKNGIKTANQVFKVGDYFIIPGTFKTIKNDAPTNAVYVQIGRRKTWIKADPCYEV